MEKIFRVAGIHTYFINIKKAHIKYVRSQRPNTNCGRTYHISISYLSINFYVEGKEQLRVYCSGARQGEAR